MVQERMVLIFSSDSRHVKIASYRRGSAKVVLRDPLTPTPLKPWLGGLSASGFP
jgi:hypothetical protein